MSGDEKIADMARREKEQYLQNLGQMAQETAQLGLTVLRLAEGNKQLTMVLAYLIGNNIQHVGGLQRAIPGNLLKNVLGTEKGNDQPD